MLAAFAPIHHILFRCTANTAWIRLRLIPKCDRPPCCARLAWFCTPDVAGDAGIVHDSWTSIGHEPRKQGHDSAGGDRHRHPVRRLFPRWIRIR
jgi:hypothetical protein